MTDQRSWVFCAFLATAVVFLPDPGIGPGPALLAQQNKQTDLEFERERAQVEALERRIRSLRRRVDALEHAASRSATQEHVLLGRGIPGADAPEVSDPRGMRSARRSSSTRIRRPVGREDTLEMRQRLNAAEQSTRELGERVNRPDFGAGLRRLKRELNRIESDIARFE